MKIDQFPLSDQELSRLGSEDREHARKFGKLSPELRAAALQVLARSSDDWEASALLRIENSTEESELRERGGTWGFSFHRTPKENLDEIDRDVMGWVRRNVA